jgi:hypothetical protein
MNPKEKLIARLAAIKWRPDGKEGIKSASLSEQDAEQLNILASLHLDTRQVLIPGIQPNSMSMQFPKTDLPRLVAYGLKFPGSDAITPEVLENQEE